MHNRNNKNLSYEKCETVTEVCTCFNIRKVTRSVTQIFDDALRSRGIRSGQFIFLTMTRMLGSATIQKLAESLWIDRTALSRNIRPLLRKKLICIEPGPDRRTRWISLTPLGQETIIDAYPLWEEAQEKITAIFGEDVLGSLLGSLNDCSDKLKSQSDEKTTLKKSKNSDEKLISQNELVAAN